MTNSFKKIAFQGLPGAFSDLACREAYPDLETVPCPSFEDAFVAVQERQADLAMIPVDNTIAGRVADVHYLLPKNDLYIVNEHFQPVRHHLLGVKGASVEDIQEVYSHVHALPQCDKLIKSRGLKKRVYADTASAASYVAECHDRSKGAISSSLAADIYGLDVLLEDIQDEDHNTTRFLVLSRDHIIPPVDADQPTLTSFIFGVQNIPAALYKTLGGFATNGISLTKLESYYVGEGFKTAKFYCEVEGHPQSRALTLAIEELNFYAEGVKLLGSYPAHPFRYQ